MAMFESLSFAWPLAALALPLPWLLGRRRAVAGEPLLRVPDLAAFAASPAAGSGVAAGAGMAPSPPRKALHAPALLAALAWLALVIAAMRPQWVDPELAAPTSGRELMLALDVSASMGTADMRLGERTLTRLEAARALAADFVGRRAGDRVGLIVFGGQAYLHTPLSFDLAAVEAAIASVDTGLAGPQTALGDAIALAVRRLGEHRDSARVLVLLTDGAHNAGALSPEQGLWLAQREGLRLFAVGLGAPLPGDGLPASNASSPMPSMQPTPAPADPASLDESTLRRLAERSGGFYRHAADGDALAEFFRRIDAQEPVVSADAARLAVELYSWPLTVALLFAMALLLPSARRGAAGGAAR